MENGAPVNLGQLKNVADRARRHLDGTLAKAGGAGAAVTAMCKFTQTDNYAPATVGQLKNVAKVFYDRLGEVGYNWQTGSFGTPSTPYPWTGTINAENQAPCNVGQMKNLFTVEITGAFLALDADSDGIPSYWEFFYSLDPNGSSDSGADPDGDDLNNRGEYLAGGLPHNPDSDGDGATDLEEVSAATDLRSDASTPVSLCYLASRVHWNVNSLPPDPPNQVEADYPVWFDGLQYWTERQFATNYIVAFENCYPGRDKLGNCASSGGTGGPKTDALLALSTQLPGPPGKNIPFGIVGNVYAQSIADFGSDGSGGAWTEAMSVWIRGPKRPADTTYLIRKTAIRQGPAPLAPGEEITFETITLPKDSNSSDTKPYTPHLSATLPRRNYSESMQINLDLVPVDLDIVHPASGELDEAKEDAGDGGYVSVQRLDDPAIAASDVAPKTKLVVRAISGAQATWKTRLKFTKADRYKIYRDEARTQEVVSESTELPTNADTTLWFHGLKKSLTRGGESVTMQINVGGTGSTWIDGDAVKCSIVQSEFLFQIKAFIPYSWTEAEDTPIFVPNPMSGKIAKGDLYPFAGDRKRPVGFINSYSTRLPAALFLKAPFRVCQTVILTPYPELHATSDVVEKRELISAPLSEHYYKTSVDPSETSLQMGFLQLNPAGFIKSGVPPENEPAYDNLFRGGSLTSISIDGGARDGAMPTGTLWASRDIHWTMGLNVVTTNSLEPKVSFSGQHDRYPAYEIIVNQSDGSFIDVHRFSPAAGERPGLVSLDDANGPTVSGTKTITK